MFQQLTPNENINPPTYSLPVPLTQLIGREHAIDDVLTLLRQSNVRLLTLTGSGGIGKTRLAIQVATELLHDFADGVCFVPLALINDPELVLPTIAQTLGLREKREQSAQEQLHMHLRTQRILLVLDNYEQVEATAPLLVEILASCPLLKILVTSRSILHVQGEQEYPVALLALPHPTTNSDILTQYASVALFLDRVRASKPYFQITPANASVIAEICIRLDGLPLAIELAAARLNVLSVEQIAMRLNEAWRLLTSDSKTALPRHQTLRATIEWSYSLLSEQERTLFRRLCVFAGSWTLEAVENICADSEIEEEHVLELLSHLIDKSLLHTQERNGVVRYWMLQLIQQFGQEKLEAGDEAANIRTRHRDWYLWLAEQAAPELVGRQQAAWLDSLEVEHDNIRLALRWSLEQREGEKAAGIGVSIWLFWLLRGYLREAQQWLTRTLAELPEPTSVRAKVLWATGIISGRLGDSSRATSLLEESLHMWRILGDKKGIASTLSSIGVGALSHGDYEQAMIHFEEGFPLLLEVGDTQGAAVALSSLGVIHFYRGNHEQARSLCEESLALCRDVGDVRGIAATLVNLAMMSLERGNYEHAKKLCEESLSLRQQVGDKGGYAHTLAMLGRVAFFQHRYEQATLYYKESLVLRQELEENDGVAAALEGLAGIRAVHRQVRGAITMLSVAEVLRATTYTTLSPVDRAFKERVLATIRAEMSERDFTATWDEGRSLTPEQALAFQEPLTLPIAQSPLVHAISAPPLSDANELTAREMEVLRLVAQGLADKEVAGRLMISPRTVQGHVRSIYNKLNINSRSSATRYAIDHKLV